MKSMLAVAVLGALAMTASAQNQNKPQAPAAKEKATEKPPAAPTFTAEDAKATAAAWEESFIMGAPRFEEGHTVALRC